MVLVSDEDLYIQLLDGVTQPSLPEAAPSGGGHCTV